MNQSSTETDFHEDGKHISNQSSTCMPTIWDFFFAFLAYNVGIKKNPDFFLDTLII